MRIADCGKQSKSVLRRPFFGKKQPLSRRFPAVVSSERSHRAPPARVRGPDHATVRDPITAAPAQPQILVTRFLMLRLSYNEFVIKRKQKLPLNHYNSMTKINYALECGHSTTMSLESVDQENYVPRAAGGLHGVASGTREQTLCGRQLRECTPPVVGPAGQNPCKAHMLKTLGLLDSTGA